MAHRDGRVMTRLAEELAERAELHRTYIGQIERAEVNLALWNVVRIASTLNVDVGLGRGFETRRPLQRTATVQSGSGPVVRPRTRMCATTVDDTDALEHRRRRNEGSPDAAGCGA